MARKPDDWMPLHIGKYLADTAHLTRDQHGAYLLLLMAYWARGGALQDDDARFAAIAKATLAEWRKMRPVIVEFFIRVDGFLYQVRAEMELNKARANSNAKAKAGKKGAETRWQNDSTDIAEPSISHRQTDAPLPSPKPSEEEPSLRSGTRASGEWRASPKPTRKRKAPMPDDWPNAEDRLWAYGCWGNGGAPELGAMIDLECEKARDHHAKLGNQFADWTAAWRTWARKALEIYNRDKKHANTRVSAHDKGTEGATIFLAKVEARDRARAGHRAREIGDSVSEEGHGREEMGDPVRDVQRGFQEQEPGGDPLRLPALAAKSIQ